MMFVFAVTVVTVSYTHLRYAVTVENGNVLFDENNLNAEVTIINQEQPEATPTVTPEETITPVSYTHLE